jgi:hypothetical protein
MVAIIAFFVITPTKKKKGDNNKFIIVTHFHFKQKEKEKGDGNKLITIALFVITIREEKKMRLQQTCCHHLLCFKHKEGTTG